MPMPPKENPARRNARVGPVKLPADGRPGDPPAWPLVTGPTGDEREAWRQLWATPQAVAWEQLGWTRTVARYCRLMVACEKPGAGAALHNAATAMEDRLGLTPKAMRLLLWQVAGDELGERRGQEQTDKAGVRKRLRAVE